MLCFHSFNFIIIIVLLLNIVYGYDCRLVCLRVHPTFSLLHPTESFVAFTSIDGSKHEVWPESGERVYQGNLVPNGKVHD